MKWKRFSMLTGSTIALTVCLYKIVVACGGEIDPYDYYPQFFPPAVLEQPAFAPLYYTSQLRYFDDWYDYTADGKIQDANIEAWEEYTGKAAPTADLDSFIYAYPYRELNSLYYNIEKGKPLDISRQVARNGFTKWFQSGKDLEALGYLMYAKSCEEYVTGSGDWENHAEPDTAKISRLIKSGQQLRAAAKKDFFKERYAYQVLRLAMYNGRYRQTLQLYTTLVGDEKEDGSEIFYRSLGIKAGALFRLKRGTEAAYLFSRVFDHSDAKKRSSYISFDWAATKDIKPVLALCKSPHEKAVMQLMDGLHNYEQALPQLKAAYAADPAARGLDVLFTREINKMEERYLQDALLKKRNLTATSWYTRYEGEYADNSPEYKAKVAKWKGYAASLIQFAEKAAAERKSSHTAFWYLAIAYLNFINGDEDATQQHLDLAAHNTMTAREDDLHKVVTALSIIRRNGGMNAATEAVLLPTMQWLDARAAKSPQFLKTYRDMMATVIATSYMQARDTVKAVFTLGRIDRDSAGNFIADSYFQDLPGVLLERMSISKLRETQAFMAKGGKSNWDAWLTRNAFYTMAVLTELEGTKFLREHRFREAVEAFKKSGRDEDRYLLKDIPAPFIAHIRDEMDLEANDTAHWYTKRAFAEKMLSLEGKEDAESLYQRGCGLYSTTYYGKAVHALSYYRSSTDDLGYYNSKERRALPAYMQDFYACTSAEQAFLKAAQKAPDVEFKARCLWMAAKCWQKRCPVTKKKSRYDSYDDKAYYLYSLTNPYFPQIGSGSAFAKEAYSSCGYLRDYAAKRK